MSSPRLKAVYGVSFGPFREPFRLELPPSGLVHLDGINKETGGSSGSGKSSLIHALNHPFGTCEVPATELQTWGTETPPRVTELYDIDGKIVEVTRGKKFEIEEDGIPFSGSAVQKEIRLNEIFGLDAEMRSTLTYRGQGEKGKFLSMTNARMNEFLTSLLGLGRFEKASETGAANIKRLELEFDTNKATYLSLKERLDQVGEIGDQAACQDAIEQHQRRAALHQKMISSLTEKTQQLQLSANEAAERVSLEHAPEIEALKKKLTTLQGVMFSEPPATEEMGRAHAMATECKRRLDALVTADNERRVATDRLRADYNKNIQSVNLKAGASHGLLASQDRINSDLKALAQNTCPTCLREWLENQDKQAQLNAELAVVVAKLADCAFAKSEGIRLTQELAAVPAFEPNPMVASMQKALQVAQGQVEAERQKARSAVEIQKADHSMTMAEVRVEQATLTIKVAQLMEEAKQKELAGIDGVQALIEENRTALKVQEQAQAPLREKLVVWEDRRRQVILYQETLDSLSGKLSKIETDLNAEKDFLRLIGREGFLGAIFDEVLAEISAETNDVLAAIANTRNCTLRFESESFTQKGTIRKEIKPIITINGYNTSLKYGPSGGMKSAIMLAVDLAVGAVISRRTGQTPGWLILDEAFDGLGAVEKETCLEVLSHYTSDRLVIIVDHASETQAAFTKKILVEFSNGCSTIAA